MATYDNGLYTPWTPAGEDGAAATTAAAAAWTPTTTNWWDMTTTAAPTTTTPAYVAPTTTTTSSSSSSTTTIAVTSSSSSTTSSPSSSSSSSTSTSSRSISSSLASKISSSSTASTVQPSSVLAAADAATGQSSSSPSFKITYLLPVFIIVPCVLIFLGLAWTYGKYWAKPRSAGGGGRAQDQPGYWNAGSGTLKGGGRTKLDDIADEDEKAGLVIGKDWSNATAGGGGGRMDVEAGTPKRNRSTKWTNWMPRGLGRSGSTRSSTSSHSFNHVPFMSVSYASLDQPFVPPSQSNNANLTRSASQLDPNGARGWTWGTKPRATSSALRVMNGDQHRDNDDDEEFASRQYLTGGGGGTMGSRKYRAKKTTGSVSSRISDKVMGRLGVPSGGGGGGLSPNDMMAASPSVYSPQFSPQRSPGGGSYAELDGDDDAGLLYDDVRDEKKRDVDLDAYLGESRVGHGQLANRYLNGDADALPPRRASGRQLPPGASHDNIVTEENSYGRSQSIPTFAVNLPSAPPRSQVSPKKSKTSLLRPPPPESPRATPPPQRLFSYDFPSPPPPPGRGPLPVLPASQSRPQLPHNPNNDPFTSPPARVPFRSQPPPQLTRPNRSNTGTPFSPETAPGLFFTSPPLGSPPSSQGHPHQQYYHSNVGSPMPDFQPGALRASESAFSIAGVDNLIFPNNNDEMNMMRRSESRPLQGGLKDFVDQDKRSRKSRKEEIEQLKRSVGPSTSPVRVPVSTSHQQRLDHQHRDEGYKSITTSQALPKKTTSRSQQQPRESLGFNPTFSESPELPPLQHPSKVRAAIENLEAKSSREGGHSKTSSIDSSRSGRSTIENEMTKKKKEPRMPSPPSPQKLERSTTTLGRRNRKRHGGGGGFDSEGEEGGGGSHWEQDDDEDDDEAIKDRRVSMLLLHRSRTQSGPSTTTPTKGYEAEEMSRPLSNDPKRLSQMLRRKSTGQVLVGQNDADGQIVVDDDGKVGGGLLAAMTRRSGIFE